MGEGSPRMAPLICCLNISGYDSLQPNSFGHGFQAEISALEQATAHTS